MCDGTALLMLVAAFWSQVSSALWIGHFRCSCTISRGLKHLLKLVSLNSISIILTTYHDFQLNHFLDIYWSHILVWCQDMFSLHFLDTCTPDRQTDKQTNRQSRQTDSPCWPGIQFCKSSFQCISQTLAGCQTKPPVFKAQGSGFSSFQKHSSMLLSIV